MMRGVIVSLVSFVCFSGFSQAITDTGAKVGIGISNPTEKLHIENGVVKVRKNDNSYRFVWSRTDNTMPAGLASDGGRKVFVLADNLTRMTIDGNNGNIGIGTENPEAKLDVKGTIKAANLNLSNNTTIYKEGYGFGINTERGFLFRQNWETGIGDYV